MSCTHTWLSNASSTLRVFRILDGTQTTTSEAMSTREQPCNQRSIQNKVFLPLPTFVITEIANIPRAFGWEGISRPDHALSAEVFCHHNHFICRAHPIISKFWITKPPSSKGLCTFSHPTKQQPPLASLRPRQRKPRLILSIAFITHFGTFIAISK